MLHRDILTPLRNKAKVPEHFVGKAEFHLVDYNRMASRCRLLFGDKVFKKFDEKRYVAYLEASAKQALKDPLQKDEKNKGPSVKTGQLLPHEVTAKAMRDDGVETNLQWRGLVTKILAERTNNDLKIAAGEKTIDGVGSWLPLVDVSGSMSGEPMEVAVALGLLLAESCPKSNPFYGKVLTFESNPKLVDVNYIPDYETPIDPTLLSEAEVKAKLGSIQQRVNAVKGYSWGGSTNIEKAFDRLLELLTEGGIWGKKPKAGVTSDFVRNTKLVIFSDMEFDQARRDYYSSNSSWSTTHENIVKKFENAGFEKGAVPLIVYWNLRASRSTPVQKANHNVVALLSGFSAGILKTFMTGKVEDFTPWGQMLQSIRAELYNDLKIAAADEDSSGAHFFLG